MVVGRIVSTILAGILRFSSSRDHRADGLWFDSKRLSIRHGSRSAVGRARRRSAPGGRARTGCYWNAKTDSLYSIADLRMKSVQERQSRETPATKFPPGGTLC